jgi:catechol 2,3-dioxygenase-like lactoylglutathione lyase family enzyme
MHAGLAVRDLSAAVEFYVTKLGFRLGFTWGGEPPTFAGVNLGKVQLFLMKGTPTPNTTGAAVSFPIGDADALYEFHRANGVEVVEEIGDRAYGLRD